MGFVDWFLKHVRVVRRGAQDRPAKSGKFRNALAREDKSARMATMKRLLFLTFLGCTALHADWPGPRGPTGDGHSPAKDVPVTWSETENVVWKTPIPGKGWSSPIVVGDHVYLTTAVLKEGDDENNARADRSLRALCLDAAKGTVVWDVEVFAQEGVTAPEIHQKNSHASPTPVIEGDRLYVHFGHQGTACLDLKGTVLWTNRDNRYKPVHGNGGSLLIAGDNLIFSCDGAKNPYIVALDKTTGKEAWRTARKTNATKTFSFCTPILIDNGGESQVVSPGSNCVVGLNPENGAEIWRVNYDGYSVVPRPVFGGGLLYLSTGYDSPVLLAIKVDGAKGDLTESHLAWRVDNHAPTNPSPLLVGDELYMQADNGVVSCLDAKTGKVHYQERVGLKTSSAAPVFAGGALYFLDEMGTAVVVKPGPSALPEILSENKIDNQKTYASFAVTDGALYLRGENHLYRIGKQP
jgi:outer membrane protein assembly factor BamB